MTKHQRLGCIALCTAVVGIGGCASPQLPKLDVDSIDKELDAFRAQPICPQMR